MIAELLKNHLIHSLLSTPTAIMEIEWCSADILNKVNEVEKPWSLFLFFKVFVSRLCPTVTVNDFNFIQKNKNMGSMINILFYIKILAILYSKLLIQEQFRTTIIDQLNLIKQLVQIYPMRYIYITIDNAKKKSNFVSKKKTGYLKIEIIDDDNTIIKQTDLIDSMFLPIETVMNCLKKSIRGEPFWVITKSKMKDIILKTRQQTVHFTTNEQLKASAGVCVDQSAYFYEEKIFRKLQTLMFAIFTNNKVHKRYVQILFLFLQKYKANDERIKNLSFSNYLNRLLDNIVSILDNRLVRDLDVSKNYKMVKCYGFDNELKFDLEQNVSFRVCLECKRPIDIYIKSLFKTNEIIHDNFKNDIIYSCEHKSSHFKDVKIYSGDIRSTEMRAYFINYYYLTYEFYCNKNVFVTLELKRLNKRTEHDISIKRFIVDNNGHKTEQQDERVTFNQQSIFSEFLIEECIMVAKKEYDKHQTVSSVTLTKLCQGCQIYCFDSRFNFPNRHWGFYNLVRSWIRRKFQHPYLY